VPSFLQPVVRAGQVSSEPQPTLESDGLVLRPWASEDGAAISAAYQDPSIQRWHARSMTPDEAVQWVTKAHADWADEIAASWAVTTQAGLVGRMTLKLHLDDGWAEAAYWVLPAARGRGIASLALCIASRWAFELAGLHRVELEHSTLNHASCRAATKAGFVLEGTKRHHGLHTDGFHDMHLHALINRTNSAEGQEG
jgi:[ribosomal protein S5]-alanine N-acetyltransferase